MSESGQTEKSRHEQMFSGFRPIADVSWTGQRFRVAPPTNMASHSITSSVRYWSAAI
jgi:hypothetical protein